MIRDYDLKIADELDFSDTDADVLATSAIDLAVVRDMNPGEPLEMVILITTAFATGTSVQFVQLRGATSTPTTETVSSEVLASDDAASAAGVTIHLPITGTERWLSAHATNVGANDAGAATITVQRLGDQQSNLPV